MFRVTPHRVLRRLEGNGAGFALPKHGVGLPAQVTGYMGVPALPLKAVMADIAATGGAEPFFEFSLAVGALEPIHSVRPFFLSVWGLFVGSSLCVLWGGRKLKRYVVCHFLGLGLLHTCTGCCIGATVPPGGLNGGWSPIPYPQKRTPPPQRGRGSNNQGVLRHRARPVDVAFSLRHTSSV